MAEQKLDVKVTESGTAVVTSQLDKLSAQLGNVEKAQEKEAAATERAAKATEKLSDGLEGWLKAQEGKFAVVDRIAGLMGKVNLALELVSKAYEFGKMVVEDYILKMQKLEPVLDSVNKKLQTQAEMIKRIREAPGAAAAAAGATVAAVTPEQAERLRGLKAEEELATAKAAELQALAETQRSFIKSQVESPLENERLTDDARRQLAATTAQLKELDKVLTANEEARKRIQADINTRGQPFDTYGPEAPDKKKGAARPRSGQGRGQGGFDIADTTSGAPDQVDNTVPYGFSEKFFEGLSGGIDKFAEMAAAVREVAQAYADVADQTAAFAEATGKAAITAAVASIFAGKSAAEGISVALEAMAQQGTAEAAWWATKAIVYSFTAPALVGPALAASAGFAGVAALAGAGSALLGGGGGGGGGGGAAAPTSADFGPRRERDTGGGQTIVNVYNDGLTLSTENDIGRAVATSLRAVARSPGSQAGAIQINTGGSRRR